MMLDICYETWVQLSSFHLAGMASALTILLRRERGFFLACLKTHAISQKQDHAPIIRVVNTQTTSSYGFKYCYCDTPNTPHIMQTLQGPIARGVHLTCSKEKVTQKQHLRMTHTYKLIEEIIFMGARIKGKETRDINTWLV